MGWMWFAGPLSLLLLGLVVGLALYGASRSRGLGGRPRGADAESILKGRLARGEVEREEYDKTLADLRR